jgi:hypothetical protein
VNLDPKTFKLLGPVTSVLAALIGFGSALRSGPKRGASVCSSLLGLVGSTAWLVVAYQDYLDDGTELDLT